MASLVGNRDWQVIRAMFTSYGSMGALGGFGVLKTWSWLLMSIVFGMFSCLGNCMAFGRPVQWEPDLCPLSSSFRCCCFVLTGGGGFAVFFAVEALGTTAAWVGYGVQYRLSDASLVCVPVGVVGYDVQYRLSGASLVCVPVGVVGYDVQYRLSGASLVCVPVGVVGYGVQYRLSGASLVCVPVGVMGIPETC